MRIPIDLALDLISNHKSVILIGQTDMPLKDINDILKVSEFIVPTMLLKAKKACINSHREISWTTGQSIKECDIKYVDRDINKLYIKLKSNEIMVVELKI